MRQAIRITTMMLAMIAMVPNLATAQSKKSKGTKEEAADTSYQERTFEETREHMKAHSEWSKRNKKM